MTLFTEMFVHSTNHRRNNRFKLEGNLAERGPLASARDLSVNTQKQKLLKDGESGVYGYTKTTNQWKILRNAQNDDNLLKTN